MESLSIYGIHYIARLPVEAATGVERPARTAQTMSYLLCGSERMLFLFIDFYRFTLDRFAFLSKSSIDRLDAPANLFSFKFSN